MMWELAGLQEQAPAAEKGFSMLTAALQKKISIHRKAEKKRSAAAESQRAPKRAAKKTRTKTSGARKSSARKKRG
jgi:hypothetical protein